MVRVMPSGACPKCVRADMSRTRARAVRIPSTSRSPGTYRPGFGGSLEHQNRAPKARESKMPLRTAATRTPNTRLRAKLVRQRLSEEPYESLADLVDALKCRCAWLRVPWTNDDISDAMAMVESNRDLVPS